MRVPHGFRESLFDTHKKIQSESPHLFIDVAFFPWHQKFKSLLLLYQFIKAFEFKCMQVLLACVCFVNEWIGMVSVCVRTCCANKPETSRCAYKLHIVITRTIQTQLKSDLIRHMNASLFKLYSALITRRDSSHAFVINICAANFVFKKTYFLNNNHNSTRDTLHAHKHFKLLFSWNHTCHVYLTEIPGEKFQIFIQRGRNMKFLSVFCFFIFIALSHGHTNWWCWINIQYLYFHFDVFFLVMFVSVYNFVAEILVIG